MIVANFGSTFLSHPLHSQIFIGNDFHLFRLMKDYLDFSVNVAVIVIVSKYLGSDGTDYHECVMQTLVHCW